MTSKTGENFSLAIAITGGSGFIGQTLTDYLLRSQAAIAICDIQPPRKKNPLANYWIGSLENELPLALNSLPEKRRTLIHLAGLSHAGECERHPQRANQLNIELLQRVLEIASLHKVERILLASTGLVLSTKETIPLTEAEPYAPRGVYASTKMEAEILLNRYCNQNQIQGTVMRFANLYGNGANPDTVVMKVAQQAQIGGPISVSAFRPARDFLHIQDAIAGISAILNWRQVEPFTTFHISSGVATDIETIVRTAARLSDLGSESIIPPTNDHDLSQIALSNEKLKRLTGWAPKISLQEGLSLLING